MEPNSKETKNILIHYFGLFTTIIFSMQISICILQNELANVRIFQYIIFFQNLNCFLRSFLI